jgi:hypothetical protein
MRLVISLAALSALVFGCTPTVASAAPPAPPGCAPAAADAPTTQSSDGKTVVYVETDGSRTDATSTGDVDHQRLCISVGGARARVLLEGKGAPPDAGVERTLAGFGDLLLSPDGATLYFTSSAWVTSGAAHAVEIATGKERYLVDGSIQRVLVDGPYKGNLLASHYRLDDAHPIDSPDYRGRMVVFSVVSPTGKTIAKLPEDEKAREKALRAR